MRLALRALTPGIQDPRPTGSVTVPESRTRLAIAVRELDGASGTHQFALRCVDIVEGGLDVGSGDRDYETAFQIEQAGIHHREGLHPRDWT